MVIVIGAAVIRLVLFAHLPLMFTDDSWDYLGATYDIMRKADFNSDRLRDVRMPAYPVWLAMTQPLTAMQTDRVVLLQKALGVVTVLLAAAIGRALGGRFLPESLAAFMAFNPIFLIYEHVLMSETLFLAALLGLTLAAVVSLRGPLRWWKGAALGVMLGICILTRANAAPYGLVLLAAIGLAYFLNHGRPVSVTARAFLKFSLIAGAATALVIGPWMWRNANLYHNVSLTNFTNRNLLIYKAIHHPLDPTLPLLRETSAQLGSAEVNYDWLWRMYQFYTTPQAERVAGALVWEQISNHPDIYLYEVKDSFLGFVGFQGDFLNERTAVRILFTAISDPGRIRELTAIPDWFSRRYPAFRFNPVSGDPAVLRIWSALGLAFLRYGRPILFIVFVAAGLAYLVARLRTGDRLGQHVDNALVLLGAGYLAMIVLHAVTLTDNERYAAPFDWLPLACSGIVLAWLLDRRRAARAQRGNPIFDLTTCVRHDIVRFVGRGKYL